mgnify:CR=1 FL=1
MAKENTISLICMFITGSLLGVFLKIGGITIDSNPSVFFAIVFDVALITVISYFRGLHKL